MTKLLTVACCLFASQGFAQAPAWRLSWTQPGEVLALAQSHTYTLRVDTAAPTPLVVSCSGVSPTVICAAPMPALASGPHTLTVIATNAFGSASSEPLSGAPPARPMSVSVIVTVTIP